MPFFKKGKLGLQDVSYQFRSVRPLSKGYLFQEVVLSCMAASSNASSPSFLAVLASSIIFSIASAASSSFPKNTCLTLSGFLPALAAETYKGCAIVPPMVIITDARQYKFLYHRFRIPIRRNTIPSIIPAAVEISMPAPHSPIANPVGPFIFNNLVNHLVRSRLLPIFLPDISVITVSGVSSAIQSARRSQQIPFRLALLLLSF